MEVVIMAGRFVIGSTFEIVIGGVTKGYQTVGKSAMWIV